MKTEKRKILLIHTGGTIGMEYLDPAHTLAPETNFSQKLKKRVPELSDQNDALGANIDLKITSLYPKDSSQMTPDDWIRLARLIEKSQDDFDAFVITHGTDTLVFSGTALSYLLPYPCKPIVFTGSQLPLKDIGSDARRNLIGAIKVATKQWICESTIFFDNTLLRANRTKKIHIEEFHAFDSPNFNPLGIEKLKPFYPKIKRENISKPGLEWSFDTNIQVIKVFPGQNFSQSFSLKNTRALVIEGYGCGNLPKSIYPILKKCKTKKIPVILTSQVLSGSLQPEIYETGKEALRLKAISALDMTFEATLIKCMLLAGNNVPYENWKPLIQNNWAGELTKDVI